MQYRFGSFQVNPGARLLQRESVQLNVSRKVFDCLVYLIEHRDRALGRDELARALWKHDSVSDNQLAQVVAAVRRLVDDDGTQQQLVRTVPGFGYHWIGAVQACDAGAAGHAAGVPASTVGADAAEPARETDASTDEAAPSAPAAARESAPATTLPPPQATPAAAPPRPQWLALATLLVLLLVLAGVWRQARVDDTAPAAPAATAPTAAQVWVLPAALPDDSEAWARVGLMALVGEGLRRTGAVVVPVEKALARFREPVTSERLPQLRSELDAALVIAPRVHRLGENWVVELAAASRAYGNVRVDANASDLTAAARVAVSRLNQRLQRAGTGLDGSIDETFDLIEQAIRARDFEGALLQLSRLPAAARELPQAGILEARLDLEKGRYSAARDKAQFWIEELDRNTQPVPLARALLLKATAMRQLSQPGWTPLVDEALALLQTADSPRDLAIATQFRGIAAILANRQTDAARDLARARELFVASGDELRAAGVTSTMAQQAELQGRHMEAITLLEQSNQVLNAYGAVGPLLINARWAAYVYLNLARWDDALRITGQMQPLLQAGGGASSYEQFSYLRIRSHALLELGRLKEAEALLDEQTHLVQREMSDNPSGDGNLVERAEMFRQRARMRMMQGRWQEARAAAARGFELIGKVRGANDSFLHRDDVEALLWLLIQAQAGEAPWSPQAPALHLEPDQIRLLRAAEHDDGILARAYWHARHGDDAAAEADYRAVLAMERTRVSPNDLLVAARTYMQFLLSRGRIADASRQLDQLEANAPGVVERDYDGALTTLRVRLAEGDAQRTQAAARRVLALIGEREPPADLREVLESAAAVPSAPPG